MAKEFKEPAIREPKAGAFLAKPSVCVSSKAKASKIITGSKDDWEKSLNPAEQSFLRSWKQAMAGEFIPIEDVLAEIDDDNQDGMSC